MDQGVNFPLEPLSNKLRKQDLKEAIKFGNHKGVKKHEKCFKELMEKDVKHGYSLIIPLEKVYEIEGALMSPSNVAEQNTISPLGKVIPSQRLTHDKRVKFEGSGTLIDSRVIKEQLQDCMYGHCVLRMIHYILALRSKYPNTRILMQKIDWKSAYRRLHFFWLTAIQSIIQFDEFALLSLWATFGGSPCPNEWGNISETTTDLANAIMNHPDWDPDTLHSSLRSEIPPDK